MTRLIDLDELSADDLAKLWAATEAALRDSEPELRDTLSRRIDEAVADGRLSGDEGDKIRGQLAVRHPAAVLEQHWRSLIPDVDRPTIRPVLDHGPVPDPRQWLAEYPQRLTHVVDEAKRLTDDLPKIAGWIADLADSLGIDPDEADAFIADALRGARRGSHVG